MHSSDRLLTTDVGSLSRPQPLVDMLFAEDRRDPLDRDACNDVMRNVDKASSPTLVRSGVEVSWKAGMG